MIPRVRRRLWASTVGAVATLSLAATGCSVGSIGGSDDEASGATTTISFLVQDQEPTPTLAQALMDGFMADNPDIKITMDTQPGGTDGDNLTKTKLSTGEMSNVFFYNSGSLLQALNPDTQLVNLADQSWVADLNETYKPVVSTANGTYGAPLGTTQGGGVLYNKKVYADLDLKVPTSWSEFIANNEKIKAAGKITPIFQTYADTWTAQLFVLADFANVDAQDPEWATAYTSNQRKYADQPALQSFENQAQVFKAGFFNKNYASANYDAGVKAVATGTAAHYPMLSSAIAAVTQNYPDDVDNLGIFAMPAQDAADTRMTIWQPNALYIPKTTEGAQLEAAKKFIAWVVSPDGCAVQAKISSVSGPFAISSCELPDSVPPIVKDIEPYLQGGKSSSALEFVSPVKGPNLSQLTVEVGSGIRSPEAGAKLYDEDVKKQAQQLGLDGW